MPFLIVFSKSLLILLFLLFSVNLYIYLERKFVGHLQARRGPMTGFHGVLQPVSDVFKLMFNGQLVPDESRKVFFRLAPLFAFLPAYMVYLVLPFSRRLLLADPDASLVLVLSLLFLSMVGLSFSGWASGNEEAAVGSIYILTNLASFFLPLIVSAASISFLAGSLSLIDIVEAQSKVWFIFLQPLGAVVFLVSILRLIERSPYAFPCVDPELIASYKIEYSGVGLGFLIFTEYMNLFTMMGIFTILFLGGWEGIFRLHSVIWFLIKVYAASLFVLWIRSSLPKPRLEEVMARTGWMFLLPLALLNLILTLVFVTFIKPLI